MKKIFTLFIACFVLTAVHLSAQNFYNISTVLFQTSHNYDCGNDGGVGNPEPRWRIRVKTTTGSWSSPFVYNPGDGIACGTLNPTLTLSSYNNICDTSLIFEIESWEEDGCGGDNTYDAGCTNGDDNHSMANYVLDFNETPDGATLNQTFNESNGYTATILYTVNKSQVPYPYPNDTSICPNFQASSEIYNIKFHPSNTYKWYSNASLTTLEFTGEPFITTGLTATDTFWVVEDNGTCQSQAATFKVNVYDVETPTIVRTTGDYLDATTTLGANYEWFLDGVSIANNTSGDFECSQSGVYRVVVTDANGCIASSADFECWKTGIADNLGLTDISVYPNPSNGFINIQSSIQITSIQLIDFSGKLVYENQSNLKGIDLSNVENGMYLLQIHTDNGMVSKKIVKN